MPNRHNNTVNTSITGTGKTLFHSEKPYWRISYNMVILKEYTVVRQKLGHVFTPKTRTSAKIWPTLFLHQNHLAKVELLIYFLKY